ncbi:MAG: four helix bundle protein [Phycisphaerae bacterium]|nr:four helix bundle protein [Phycisphaerae bacterium]
MRSYRDLVAWQKAIHLCKLVYRISSEFPDRERFGLTAQIRRAAVSIPSNIAEGYGRRRTQDYLRFLDVARGSLCEVETQAVLAHELEMIGVELAREVDLAATELHRVLFGLSESIRNSSEK